MCLLALLSDHRLPRQNNVFVSGFLFSHIVPKTSYCFTAGCRTQCFRSVCHARVCLWLNISAYLQKLLQRADVMFSPHSLKREPSCCKATDVAIIIIKKKK